MQHNNNNSPKEPERFPFVEIFSELPPALKAEFWKRIAGAAVALIATVIILSITKDWTSCIGFLFTGFFTYMALNIVWRFAAGQLMVARVVVSKAKRHKNGRISVILRPADSDLTTGDVQTFSCDLFANLKNRYFITAGTVLNIYFYENTPHSIVAYDILGERGG